MIDGIFTIENCKFHSNISLEYTTFNSIVSFYNNEIKKDIGLSFTRFKEYADFSFSSFKNINLITTIFDRGCSFLYCDVKVENRETARIIKDSFEQQNNIIEANKFYALEMKEREKELSWSKNFLEKLVFSFHGWSSNHSQEWLLALFWILNISFITSMFCSRITEKTDFLGYLDISLSIGISILILGIILLNLKKYIGNWAITFLSLGMYFMYSNISGDKKLDNIANHINPFSIMNSWDNLSFGELIFKITIAYLIYQLIISIRQNTRRK
jgi:hypothetical protein